MYFPVSGSIFNANNPVDLLIIVLLDHIFAFVVMGLAQGVVVFVYFFVKSAVWIGVLKEAIILISLERHLGFNLLASQARKVIISTQVEALMSLLSQLLDQVVLWSVIKNKDDRKQADWHEHETDRTFRLRHLHVLWQVLLR